MGVAGYDFEWSVILVSWAKADNEKVRNNNNRFNFIRLDSIASAKKREKKIGIVYKKCNFTDWLY